MQRKDKEVGKYAMEFISTALKAQGDTVKWIASLKDGIKSILNIHSSLDI